MYYDFKGIYAQISKGYNIEIGRFKRLFGSKRRLQVIQQKDIRVNGIYELLLSLIQLNKTKFSITLTLTVTSPLFTNWIIQNYLNQNKENSLLFLILILLGYKIFKAIHSILLDICHQSIGFQYFAKMYHHVLINYHVINGKILNLIQYDCNIIVFLAYTLLSSIFNFIQLVIIIILIIHYIQKARHLYIFFIIIVLYIVSQALVNYFTFKYNKIYLNGKDNRLGSNIDNQSHQQTIKKRQTELKFNKLFINLKIVDKFITIVYPIMINIYVFVIIDRESINQAQYIIFILISLIRIPINTLIFTLNLMVQVLYSANRIIKMNKNIPNQDNRISLVSQLVQDQSQKSLKITRRQLKSGQRINKQKGEINIKKILSYCYSCVSNIKCYSFFASSLIAVVVIGNIFNFYISKHLITNNYNTDDFIGLACLLFSRLLLFKIINLICSKISNSLFDKLQNQTLNCESLNRISGDISAIDRSLPINLFQFINYLLFIISSYCYSIISLQNIYIQICLFLFFLLCIIIAYKANRYIMLSKRQVSRNQYFLKAKIIKSLMKNQKINESHKMQKVWRKMFECKEMGLMVQNYFFGFLNLLLIVFSLILVGISKYLDLNQADKSILFIACLNIDYDILKMFLTSIHLEISLISFQRVINVIQK